MLHSLMGFTNLTDKKLNDCLQYIHAVPAFWSKVFNGSFTVLK